MYASQEFVDEVNRLNLTGVSFDLVWEGQLLTIYWAKWDICYQMGTEQLTKGGE